MLNLNAQIMHFNSNEYCLNFKNNACKVKHIISQKNLFLNFS